MQIAEVMGKKLKVVMIDFLLVVCCIKYYWVLVKGLKKIKIGPQEHSQKFNALWGNFVELQFLTYKKFNYYGA